MTNEEFIHTNCKADLRSLALKKMPEGVDALWCMRQIEGYQLAKKKLPRWAETKGILFPPRISMEQCSSESTAQYKSETVKRLIQCTNNSSDIKHSNDSVIPTYSRFADLTGGFGVDFSYMAKGFKEAFYIEQQEVLCQAAQHNMPLLGLSDVHIINGDSTQLPLDSHFDVIFLDPARRDMTGRKTIAIEDCTPDITSLQERLLSHSTYVIVKLSPMLDITQALRSLHNVTEVHVISVKGECKELLFVQSKKMPSDIVTYCVNLETNDSPFIIDPSIQKRGESFTMGSDLFVKENVENLVGNILFEPNASIMKAGKQDAFAVEYGLKKLHPMSNLYFTEVQPEAEALRSCPARVFRICDIYDFSKSELKRLRSNIKTANITIRNFPSTVAELRKRLKIKEGGSDYIFVTTIDSICTSQSDRRHIIILCRKFE